MKRLFKITFAIGLLGIFAFVVLPRYGRWLKHGNCFRIAKIEVEGNDLLMSKEILKLARIRMKANIWSVDLKAAENRIASNPWIGRVSVFRRHPDAVRILVEEKKPVALLKSNGRFYALDRKRPCFPRIRENATPTFFSIGKASENP
jgi:cell division septal protein FtsQ